MDARGYVQEMEVAARSAAFPAISAVLATDSGDACPAAPKAAGSAAAAPSPAADGPTFYKCGSLPCADPH